MTIFSRFLRISSCALITALLASCASRYTDMPSSNMGERVKLLVLHYTAINYARSVHALVDEGGLSAHYLVTDPSDPTFPGSDATVLQLVPESKRAWHAGSSVWQGRNHLNDTSIGVEIVNVPECKRDTSQSQSTAEFANNRLCVYPDYHPQQIEALIALSQDIIARNPDIEPTAVVGHSDIAFARKNDPGPRFPWYQLYLAGVGAWYDNDSLIQHWQQFNQSLPAIGLTQAALREYGYGVVETGIMDEQTLNAISAFQMHFVQDKVTGRLDSDTLAALFALLEKYFPAKYKSLMARYTAEAIALTASQKAFPPYFRLGQIDDTFPQQDRSSRREVNDKVGFKAYQGRGALRITPTVTTDATIKVNGETLVLDSPLNAGTTYSYSLKKRTRDGLNTFELTNLSDAQASLDVTIPWPRLNDQTSKWQDDFTAVDALIQQDIDDGFPGAVLLVVKDGNIIKRSAYGSALKYDEQGNVLAHPEQMTTDTLFDVASNTKMFATNLALMKLVSEGKLNVDAPLSQYLPEYTGNGRDARSVRDLLSHQTGYGPEVRFFEPGAQGNRFRSRSKKHTEALLTSAVPFITGNRVKAAYSDTNFMLLGLLVERITGMALDRYCEQFLYAPLQLNHTVFNPLTKGVPSTNIAATEINGNSRSGNITFPGIRIHTLKGEVHDEKAWYSMGGVSGHAGLFSTVDDFAVMMQLLLNGGGYGQVTLLDPDTVALFTGPSSLDPGFGLGWRRAADGRNRWHFGPYASHTAYGHTGWTGTVTVIDPTQDMAIVLFTNARHSPVGKDTDGNLQFASTDFETGKYGSVVSRIYEAVLNHR